MGSYSSILVAGGAGFVGSNLALRLRSRYPDARVVVVDNLKRRGSEWNLPRLAAANVEFAHGDVRRPDDLTFPKTRFELVVDCSAEPAVLAAYEQGPSYVIDTNLVGTVNLLEVARRDGADVVFLSTSRVYPVAAIEMIAYEEEATRFRIAQRQTLPGVSAAGISEAFTLEGARSLYGTTKLACELILAEYGDMYGLRYVIDRCGVITGPWQMGKVDQGVFALWMGKHYFKRPLSFIGYGGTGKQVRDFLAVDELGDLILSQIDRMDDLPRRTYNVGGGLASSLSLLELTQLCEQITGNQVEMRRIAENRAADVRLYVTDNARVHADLGWAPRKSPRETLQQIYDWIREHERMVAPLWS
ncbi:MAG TPA: NAD-dependent epimerase/dehydratase family protein [Candidatus Sulfotelmatobacter sp.]|nr:NAD-dependent epimerase/dehydratase family protein [Candidatus Sulfotelmatobacter sp.]